jgi:pyruvate/2-oxoglutarate dehydrogenase complex dihydrolipoamide dehydrogenase (E3) component
LVVESMRAMNLARFQHSGMELVFGAARFVARRRVEVSTPEGGVRLLEGEHVVINLGTRPALPPIDGLADARPLTSESLLELERIPQRLLVLGAGTVGIELGQAMQRLGSRVTLVGNGAQVLPREEPDVAADLADILAAEGMQIHLRTGVHRVERTVDGSVRVDGRTDGEPISVVADDVLVALGRLPNTADAGLHEAGVELDDRGFVRVDEFLRTSEPQTYAVGDVNGGPQFTHVSLDDHRVVRSNLQGGTRSTRGRLIPHCVFTDPELGRVGMTEAQARRARHDVAIARMPTSAVPRAQTLGETRGTFKAVVERGTGRILGATVLGAHGGEVIAALQMAMLGSLTADDLRDGLIAHPTMAEGLNQLFAGWDS